MNRKLFINALITSPIIAIYGASPFYIFNAIPTATFLILILGLSVNVFVVWLVHIFFAYKLPSLNNFWRFIVTYTANIAFRLVFYFIDPLVNIPKPEFVDKYLAYPILTSFVLNAIVMVMVNNIVTTHLKNKAQKELQELKIENAVAQKQVLLQQLQPHFLFNSLSILKSLIQENSKQAEDYILHLSEFLRYSIKLSKTDIVSVEKELQFTKDYIELQKMRFGDSFKYEINTPMEIMDKQIPILSLQILIENIFKHNYFTSTNPMHFSISYNTGFICIENEKTSMRINEKLGTGLENLNKRYQLICNKNITIIDAEEKFIVKIPIIEK